MNENASSGSKLIEKSFAPKLVQAPFIQVKHSSPCAAETPPADLPSRVTECDILSQESSPLKMGSKIQQYTRRQAQASLLSLQRLLVPIGPEQSEMPLVVLEPRSNGSDHSRGKASPPLP